MANLNDEYSKATSLLSTNNDLAEGILYGIIQDPRNDDASLLVKENALSKLAEFYEKRKAPEKIKNIVENITPIIQSFSKAKASKIIKVLMDTMDRIGDTQIHVSICEYLVKWCLQEKRNFLRHRIELRLATLLWKLGNFPKALDMVQNLLKEMKQVDDKHILLECHLLESKVQHSLENVPKSRASLTNGRACANSIYCPPHIQAELDLMSGILYSEDKDYQTAYSYFFESYEAFNTFDEKAAKKTLKYMILSKIMTNSIDEATQILNGKHGVKHWGPELEAMKAITKANKTKSLKEFQSALAQHDQIVKDDPLLKIHIQNLYENLLEQNLLKVVEPYSKVQIDHISKQLNLTPELVQSKLSEMILDKKIEGTLDQGNGCLIIFDEVKSDKLYQNALDLMGNMDSVVDKLFEKSKKIKV